MTPSPSRQSYKRPLLLGALAVVLLGGFLLVMFRVGPLAPTRVTVVKVSEGSFAPELFGIGTVEARRSWLIGPTVAGRVLRVHADVGDTVRAGQVLAEMDPVDLDQKLNSFEASSARARSAQAAASAQQADANARRELASSNLKRNRDLAEKGFISSGALEVKVQELASANAAAQAASANVSAAVQDLNRTLADRSALLQQRANVRLIAPSTGIVTARDAEAGSTVLAGQSVLRVIDPASLWVRLRVEQGRSAGVAPGQKARIVLRSRPQQSFAGTVARLELLGDSVTEERIVQLRFDKTPDGVSVGEMAEATIGLAVLGRSLIVPSAAIQRQAGSTGVWRMVSGKPEFAVVMLGATSLDGQSQILKGLSAGDEIVVYSQKPLSGGARIDVVDALVRKAAAPGATR